MSRDPVAARLLEALDCASELAAAEERHERRLRRLLLDLVDVLDAFDRLLEAPRQGGAAADPASVPARSVARVAEMLERALRREEVVPLACLGLEADPERHRILGSRDGENGPETIVEVLTRGYRWGDRPLRPAGVIVSGKRKEAEP